MNWILLWKFVLLLTLGGYSLLVIITSLGGIKNIISMLRDLRQPPDESP
ncbi:MAG: hypothetical protein JXB23_17380 [Candidatus Aminicenantes bacterium]|nr:hypothetical protein [Candidatus Aminicenantes bacterium]